MSQKTEKPVLSGQRIKTRKRDEKEKYDPAGFRDFIVSGLAGAGNDVDAIYKFLDTAGSKVDYRRYGEALFDILIAGGLLVPGGSVAQDGDKVCETSACIFKAPDDMQTLKNFEQVFMKLMRRYKYLEKMFLEEMKKILLFIKGFEQHERIKLAKMTALWIANGSVPPQVLTVLLNEHLIKDGLAFEFLIEVFVTWKQEKGLTSLMTGLKKGSLERRLMDFLPQNKRTDDHFKSVLEEKDLHEIVKLHLAQESEGAKRQLEAKLKAMMVEGKSVKNIITEAHKVANSSNIPEQEAIALIWAVIMSQVEWNKKEELLTEQALKHLKQYSNLLASFTVNPKSEMILMIKVQEFCYENMNFMKVFHKIILLFYKAEILSEEVIMKWYKEPQSSKGKIMFIEQLKPFVEWLQNAEEETDSSEDEEE